MTRYFLCLFFLIASARASSSCQADDLSLIQVSERSQAPGNGSQPAKSVSHDAVKDDATIEPAGAAGVKDAVNDGVKIEPARPATSNWLTVYGLVAIICVAITPVALYESPKSFLIVIAYLAAITLVKMYVKEAINLGFPYPDAITSMHMMAVCVVTFIWERPHKEEAWHVLPISVLNGLSLLTNNKALLYGGVAFVSMIAANVPLGTFLLELCRGTRSFTLLGGAAVLIVCCGSAFCIRGELNGSTAAFVLATVSALLRSMRGVWQHELLTVSVSPVRLVFWNGFWSLLISMAFMACGEGLSGLHAFQSMSSSALRALFCSIVAAVALNITQWYAMKALGALMSCIIGNLNLILVIALSTAWLHEAVTMPQYGGVTLLALGTFLNKISDQWLKAKANSPSASPRKAQNTPTTSPRKS